MNASTPFSLGSNSSSIKTLLKGDNSTESVYGRTKTKVCQCVNVLSYPGKCTLDSKRTKPRPWLCQWRQAPVAFVVLAGRVAHAPTSAEQSVSCLPTSTFFSNARSTHPTSRFGRWPLHLRVMVVTSKLNETSYNPTVRPITLLATIP